MNRLLPHAWLLTAVVAFRTTIPNRPSIVPMFGLPDKRSSTVFSGYHSCFGEVPDLILDGKAGYLD
jgi:hypothetical protein